GLYEKLYDKVASNMESAGKVFPYRKETFLREAGTAPDVIDVERYLDLENEEFFQAVFQVAYKRLYDEKEYEVWKKHFSMEKDEFRKKFLKSIESSTVIAINRQTIINNPYFKMKKGIRYFILGRLYGLTDKSSLRTFGKKMPGFIQKIIRKVFI
ncbi:MAG: hypothetical protein K6F84_04575, partial [Lachnospiraceae bacterium]|nr:hypothetical protein [Lachnospiraceae bacterium]